MQDLVVFLHSGLTVTTFDSFARAGRNVVVAKKLGRRFIGLEISLSYVRLMSGLRSAGSPLPETGRTKYRIDKVCCPGFARGISRPPQQFLNSPHSSIVDCIEVRKDGRFN